ncbi:MAG: hypothetical protein IJJ41_04165 [Clostridia bacterium]|nr:hypothetical protein [Clostridia bacterium]
MEQAYLINFIYESGKEMLLLDRDYLQLPTLEAVQAFAEKRMKRYNGDYVSSIVGKIARYEILQANRIR